MYIKVAGACLSFNDDFFKLLSGSEKELLRPFILKTSNRAVKENNGFSVHTELIKPATGRSIFYKRDFSAPRFESFFSKRIQCGPGLAYELFEKVYLPYYLNARPRSRRNILCAVEHSPENYMLVISLFGFMLYDRAKRHVQSLIRPKRIKFFIRPDKGTVKLKAGRKAVKSTPYYLNWLKAVFRIILLAGRKGVIVHASSVEFSGQGYIFLGPGNAGKSTVVKMLKPDRVFSDDTAVICREGNEYMIFPNPWRNANSRFAAGDTEKPANLRAIFVLKKADKTGLERLSFKQAVEAILFRDHEFQQHCFYDDKQGLERFYDFSSKLAQDVPVYLLSVKKSRHFRREFEKLNFLRKPESMLFLVAIGKVPIFILVYTPLNFL